jgi:hypothetical protein
MLFQVRQYGIKVHGVPLWIYCAISTSRQDKSNYYPRLLSQEQTETNMLGLHFIITHHIIITLSATLMVDFLAILSTDSVVSGVFRVR